MKYKIEIELEYDDDLTDQELKQLGLAMASGGKIYLSTIRSGVSIKFTSKPYDPEDDNGTYL